MPHNQAQGSPSAAYVTRWARPALLMAGAALALASCGGGGGTTAQKVTRWMHDAGQASLDSQLVADAGHITAAAARPNVNTLHTVCAVLATDVQKANTNLPTPDPPLTADLTTAYNAFYAGSQDCYAGATSAPSLNRALSELQLANATLDSANNLVRLVTRSSQS
jgi:hypothetical protein